MGGIKPMAMTLGINKTVKVKSSDVLLEYDTGKFEDQTYDMAFDN